MLKHNDFIFLKIKLKVNNRNIVSSNKRENIHDEDNVNGGPISNESCRVKRMRRKHVRNHRCYSSEFFSFLFLVLNAYSVYSL